MTFLLNLLKIGLFEATDSLHSHEVNLVAANISEIETILLVEF
jgi:hypothetical protein